MNIIEGNILDIIEGIIAHQVNCKGVAGVGLAKQIRLKYTSGANGVGWYNDFSTKWHKDNHDPLKGANLGTVGWYYVSTSPELIIANLYAQFDYGRDKQHTSYDALRACLTIVKLNCGKRKVYLPFGLGSNNAGGNWQVVSAMIDEILPMAIVVKWNGST